MAGIKVSYHPQNSRSILQALKSQWRPRLPVDDIYAFYAVSHSQKVPVDEKAYLQAKRLEAAWGLPLIEEGVSREGLHSCALTYDGRRLLGPVRSILRQAMLAERFLWSSELFLGESPR